jgi:hypothetical protein
MEPRATGSSPRTQEVEIGMRKLCLLLIAAFAICLLPAGVALAAGPSGSSECQLADDDCDGALDEDAAGDTNGDGNADDDLDGAVDEDPAGDAADDAGENQVDCNESASQDVGGVVYLYVGANGIEGCADDGSQLPVDGRGAVTTDDGGYATIDGDNSNPAPSNGYVRVDQTGVHCGDESNQDSGGDQSTNTAEDCG